MFRLVIRSIMGVVFSLSVFSVSAVPDMGGPPPAMPSIKETTYQAHIAVNDGVLSSSLRQKLNPHYLYDLSLSNERDDTNGLVLLGKRSAMIVENSRITSRGDGSNDFLGKGAGVLVSEGMLVLDGVNVSTQGVIASAVVAAEGATLKAYDSVFRAAGGTLPGDYVPVIGPGMKEPPAPLGITGTARTHLTMSNAHSYFYNCRFEALGWGALSTDAAGGDAYLEVNDSEIIVKNSGYGAYADFGARIIINRSSINAATYTGVIAGAAELALHDSATVSDRNIVMIHSVMGDPAESGRLAITGGEHDSTGTALVIKSANADITLDDTRITAGNGQLLLALVNDDPMRTQVGNMTPPGSKVAVTRSQLQGDISNEDSERNLIVYLGSDASLEGGLKNVMLDIADTGHWHASKDSEINADSSAIVDHISVAKGVNVTVTVPAPGGRADTLTTATGGRIHLFVGS